MSKLSNYIPTATGTFWFFISLGTVFIIGGIIGLLILGWKQLFEFL